MASEQEVADGRSERELGRSADLGVAHAGLRDPEVRQLATERQRAVETRTQADLDGGLNNRHLVEAMERCGNRRPRVQKLVSAWNQGIRCTTNSEGEADDALIGAAVEPSKRPRTRLTDKEVDAMRTARAQGISVNAVAKQFGVHRGTVWAKTKLPL